MQVLEEIKQQDVVEEFSAPVFSLQLVLGVPEQMKDRQGPGSADLKVASQSPYLKQAFMDGASSKKSVKFETENSGECMKDGGTTVCSFHISLSKAFWR